MLTTCESQVTGRSTADGHAAVAAKAYRTPFFHLHFVRPQLLSYHFTLPFDKQPTKFTLYLNFFAANLIPAIFT